MNLAIHNRRILAALLLAATQTLPGQSRSAPGGLPPRDEYQRVPDILAALGPMDGKRVADIAAGDGYLTRPLSKLVGASGRVFAVEISAEAREKLAALGLTNVEVVASTEHDPRLPADLDGAVILNSYHEITDYRAMLAGILKALRPGARLVLVDNLAPAGWFSLREEQASHHALEPRFVEAELKDAGFEIVQRTDGFITQPYAQWMIVARRHTTMR